MGSSVCCKRASKLERITFLLNLLALMISLLMDLNVLSITQQEGKIPHLQDRPVETKEESSSPENWRSVFASCPPFAHPSLSLGSFFDKLETKVMIQGIGLSSVWFLLLFLWFLLIRQQTTREHVSVTASSSRSQLRFLGNQNYSKSCILRYFGCHLLIL